MLTLIFGINIVKRYIVVYSLGIAFKYVMLVTNAEYRPLRVSYVTNVIEFGLRGISALLRKQSTQRAKNRCLFGGHLHSSLFCCTDSYSRRNLQY
jgi:hypothetical protein